MSVRRLPFTKNSYDLYLIDLCQVNKQFCKIPLKYGNSTATDKFRGSCQNSTAHGTV